MSDLPPCPQCASEHTYPDREFLVCPECGHEWSPGEAAGAEAAGDADGETDEKVVDADFEEVKDDDEKKSA